MDFKEGDFVTVFASDMVGQFDGTIHKIDDASMAVMPDSEVMWRWFGYEWFRIDAAEWRTRVKLREV